MGLNRYGRLFYMFHPDFWGGGYCTEALRAFQKRLFIEQPNLSFLVANVHERNDRSSRVLQKCGFVQAESLKAAYALNERETARIEGTEGLEKSHMWYRYERPSSTMNA
jgi:RimJ/RimL family protein N-acetyltransferase